MTTDAEDWLTRNTFECGKLKARLRQDQCRSNYERAPGMEWPGLLAACIDCETGSGQAPTEGKKGEIPMRQAPKCVEPGCNKFRVRHQRCSKHAGEYLARIAAEGGGMSETPAELHKETPIGEKPLETKVPADFTERLEGIEFVKMDDSAVEAGDQAQEAPAMRSLLYFLQVPPTPPRRPGVFVDFTGNEELLAQVEALTDDLSHDVISLLRGLLNGELCKRKDEPVGLCE